MYRNPIEEWYWESGLGYWVIIGFVVLASLFLSVVGHQFYFLRHDLSRRRRLFLGASCVILAVLLAHIFVILTLPASLPLNLSDAGHWSEHNRSRRDAIIEVAQTTQKIVDTKN